MLRRAGIVLTSRERRRIEVADFGLSDLARTGLQLVIYANTTRYCAKELVMFPRQTCPEHWHPPVKGHPGKMETFRCRWGEVYLYVPGRRIRRPKTRPPRSRREYYTARHKITLRPGQQYTIPPETPHWFQAGPRGAIISEFSSTSRDRSDVFRNPGIRRMTKVY